MHLLVRYSFNHTPLAFSSPSGEPVLPPEHCAGFDHQAESDPPGGNQPLHKSRQSHAHPSTPPGHPDRPAVLQTRGPPLQRDLRVSDGHPDPLPGKKVGLAFMS